MIFEEGDLDSEQIGKLLSIVKRGRGLIPRLILVVKRGSNIQREKAYLPSLKFSSS